jgi:uncharacterized protein
MPIYTGYTMNPEDFYIFTECDKSFLLHIPTSIYFELDDVAHTFFTVLQESPKKAYEKVLNNFGLEEADEMLKEFLAFEEEAAHIERPFTPSTEITSISLNVAQECNLNCVYCYGQKGTYGFQGSMSPRVGEASIDFLFDQLCNAKDCSIGFFGGEPLLNFQLISHLVPYAVKKAESYGKNVHFTVTTNGTFLTNEVIRFLNRNKIGVVVSIDGPPEIQDHNRPFKNGKGSYDVVYPGIKKLLASRQGKITARATSARDAYYTVFNHLVDMGFRQVHIESATGELFNIKDIVRDYRKIKNDIIKTVKEKRHVLFSNFSDLMGKTYLTVKRFHGCGAGLKYVGISVKGHIYVCHRFVGIPEFCMGTVWDFDAGVQERIIENTVDKRSDCKPCWARYYCGGGCIYEAYFYNMDIGKPYTNRCDLFKTALTLSIWLYSHLKEEDQSILDDMYEKYTRDYMKNEDRIVNR